MSKINLFPKQQEAYNTFLDKKRIFLHWDTGVGKTLLFIYAIKDYWIRENHCKPALFLGTVGVFDAVKDALLLNGLDERYYSILDTPKKRDAFYSGNIKPLTIMSYDIFKNKNNIDCKRGWKGNVDLKPFGRIADLNPQFIAIDESHKIKSIKSQVGKSVSMISRMNPKYIMMGSATSIEKDQSDLFNQFYTLDGGKRLGRSIFMFQNKYFIDLNRKRAGTKGYFPNLIARDNSREDMLDQISDIYHVYKKENDASIKLPKKYFRTITVPKTIEQEKIYEELLVKARINFQEKKEMVQKGLLTKQQFYTSTLSLMSALRQVCCGFIYEKNQISEGKRNVMRIPTNKLKSLEKGISMIPFNEKFIIWSIYTESFNLISELLKKMGIEYALVTGKVIGKKRGEEIYRFKNSPSCRAFLSHPKSGGAGLNLQQAKYSFYFSKDYSFIDKVQSEGRNFRVGSIEFHKEIIEFDLKTEGTIETAIESNLTRKKHLVKSFEKYLTSTTESFSLFKKEI